MQMLCYFAIVNAILATGLAVFVWSVAHWTRRPALVHLLWVLVLVRLVMPPILIFQLTGIGRWLEEESTTVVVTKAWALVRDVASQQQRTLAMLQAGLESSSLLPQVSILPSASSLGEPVEARLIPVTQTADVGASLKWGLQRCAVAVVHYGGALLAWFGPLWVVGSIVCFVTQVILACRFRGRLRKQAYASRIWQQRAERVAARMGLHSCPSLLLVRDQVPPMLWGFAPKAYILFPEQLLQALDTRGQDTLLAHELAHYRRGDQWVRMLELVVATLFWWHPVVWWARHQLEAAEEECADAWAVQQAGGHPRTYAEALLAAVDFVSVGPMRLPPAASGLGSQLLRRRLTAIMCPRSKELALAPDGYAALLLVACLALPPCPAIWNLAFSKTLRAAANPGPPMAVVPTPQSTTAVEAAWGGGSGAARPSTPAVPPTLASASGVSLVMDAHRRVRLGAGGRHFNLGVGRVACADFLPDKASLVLGGFDGAIEVIDCHTGHVQQRTNLGLSAITSIATAPGSGRLVAAGSRDGFCRLIDLDSRRISIVASEPGASVRSVRFSVNGRHLAVTFDQPHGSRMDVWDFSAQERLGRLVTADRILAVSPQESATGWLLVYDGGDCSQWSNIAHTLAPRRRIPPELVPRLAFSPTDATSLQQLLSEF